jgi:NAD(P)-dependent dehydrogenase (short-subunit alcohol dehydrogenase family)
MELGLQGKSALVTGSTAGIGLAIAEGLAREGVRVIVNGRTEQRVNAAISDIKKNNPQAQVTGIAADMGTAAGTDRVVSSLPHVDILVNNVGIFEPKAFEKISDADWTRTFDVNVMSAVRLCRTYFGKMIEKKWGRIIFISSESGVNIPAEMIQYGVTKTAQLALARGLAEMTKGTAVTVNSVLPGPTRSEGVATFLEQLAKKEGRDLKDVEHEFFEKVRPSSLIQRFASTEEVANMVVYVASTASSATNGASLRVDGGVVRSIV